MSDILTTVLGRFRAAKQWRETHCFAGASIETWLARTYRMYNEIHHPEAVEDARRKLGVDIRGAGYYPFGRLKVDAARAYIDGTYEHAIDAPFTIEPRRNPELNDQQKGDVALMVLRLAGAQLKAVAGEWDDIWDSRNKAPKGDAAQKWFVQQSQKMAITMHDSSVQIANEACDYRRGIMIDQLDAGGWDDAWALMVHHLMADPYTVIAGREYRSIPTVKWSGKKPVRAIEVAPTWRAIDPRNFYMAADCSNAQDGSGVTELTIRTRNDLISLLMSDDESIDKAALSEAIMLVQHDVEKNDWLQFNKTLNSFEAHSLVHQGLFSGKELADMGKTGYKADEYYNATAEVCFDKLIRFEVSDYSNNTRNYYSAQHAKTTSTYCGECILTKLYTVQNQLNLALALRDRNLAMSSGPTFTFHGGYFDRPQDVSIVPYTRNWANPDPSGQASRGVDQSQIEPQYLSHNNHIDNLKRQGDEICGVVSGLQGLSRSGLSRTTLGGAVLDQTAGERMIGAAILLLDRMLIEPMIEHLDQDNLLSSTIPDEYKRGDVKIVGKGISGLREVELRGRLIAEGLPVAMQLGQQGLVPQDTLQDATKDYLNSKGFNTQGIPSRGARRELNNNMPRQTNDGRTYNPQQSTVGVAA